jgi:PAS domain S-box-containing protein
MESKHDESPTYDDLKRKVEELQKLANFKVYPHEIVKGLPFIRINKDWQLRFFDRNITELTGYTLEELLNQEFCWLDIIHENDRQMAKNALVSAMEFDDYYSAEFRIITKQGVTRWIKMRGPLFREPKGELLFIQCLVQDITDQKYVEMALESEHEIFPWVANSMEDGIYIVSDNYRIQFMNKALVDLVGDHVGELCYKALFERDSVCPWSVMDAIKQESCGFQEYHLPRIGKTFQVRSFPIRRRNGTIGKLGQLRDITRTKRLENQVQDYAARHQAIVDAADLADLGIFILQDRKGIEGRFCYANEAFCTITGYSSEELLNMSVADLTHPDSRKKTMDRYRRRQGGEPVTRAYELKMIRKDGSLLQAFISAAISTLEDRVATIGFLQDFTARKEFQKSLWLSQRLASIGKLAAEIAHEINNPLTSVLTFNKLMERIIQKDPFPVERLPELRDYIHYLNSEATRCADIARNLLDFSRNSEIEIKENNIRTILDKTIDVLRHRASMGQIEIQTSHAENLPQLACDFKRLQQAFMNILWNAIEAMPRGGVLRVATVYDPQHDLVEIAISDTGVGIGEEALEHVFEPFFTTKGEGKGVGLGLSVAYGIIRQHSGRIQVSSQPGKGTTFTIHLKTTYCDGRGVKSHENHEGQGGEPNA